MISRHFPVTHKRKGERTYFEDYINTGDKMHTIRANYQLWADRIEQVNKGVACISIRCWSGKPYKSKQEVVKNIYEASVQCIDMHAISENHVTSTIDGGACNTNTANVAFNDGLTPSDFYEWFFGGKSKHFKGVIIHFTDFKY